MKKEPTQKVRVKYAFSTTGQQFLPGQVHDVTRRNAKAWIARGFVEDYKGGPESETEERFAEKVKKGKA